MVPSDFRVVENLIDIGPQNPESKLVLDQTYNATIWQQSVNKLRIPLKHDSGAPMNIFGNKIDNTESYAKAEHVLLKGLGGISWACLPKNRLFVPDSVNETFSPLEQHFLETGAMGIWRALAARHKRLPQIGKPKGDRIEILPVEKLPKEMEFDFRIRVRTKKDFDETGLSLSITDGFYFPSSLIVSRVLSKMTYLMLCVHSHKIAFLNCFDSLRRFIVYGNSDLYKPYIETDSFPHLPTSDFGFTFHHLCYRKPGTNNFFLLDTLADVQLWGLRYTISLCGLTTTLQALYNKRRNEGDKCCTPYFKVVGKKKGRLDFSIEPKPTDSY